MSLPKPASKWTRLASGLLVVATLKGCGSADALPSPVPAEPTRAQTDSRSADSVTYGNRFNSPLLY